jgi:hypothetical protein
MVRDVQIKIDPAFHQWIKVNAAQHGMSIKKFSKHIAQKNSTGGMNFEFKI